MVNCSDCLSAEFIGLEFFSAITKLANTSILLTRTGPLRMRCVRFPQNVIKSLIKPGFLFTKGTLNRDF